MVFDNSNIKSGEFPRQLNKIEKELLFKILPENKKGYLNYMNKINELMVIGLGRFGGNNFILGKKDTNPDLQSPSTPIFAAGTVYLEDEEIDITINEEIDDEIEVDLSPKNSSALPEKLEIVKTKSFSEWNPGDLDPYKNKKVRVVLIEQDNYVLAVASAINKIWIHDINTRVNHLIPVSNFYNELMSVKNIRTKEIVLNPKLLFENIDEYSDSDLFSAFIKYNKYMRRINLDYNKILHQPEEKKRKHFKKIFSRGKN